MAICPPAATSAKNTFSGAPLESQPVESVLSPSAVVSACGLLRAQRSCACAHEPEPTSGGWLVIVSDPAGQLAHAAALVRPVCAWYVPAGQSLRVRSPGQ